MRDASPTEGARARRVVRVGVSKSFHLSIVGNKVDQNKRNAIVTKRKALIHSAPRPEGHFTNPSFAYLPFSFWFSTIEMQQFSKRETQCIFNAPKRAHENPRTTASSPAVVASYFLKKGFLQKTKTHGQKEGKGTCVEEGFSVGMVGGFSSSLENRWLGNF